MYRRSFGVTHTRSRTDICIPERGEELDKVSLNRSTTTDKLISENRDLAKKTTPKKKAEDDGLVDSMPDYVVSVSAEKLDEKSTYTPAEVKAKAKAFMNMGASPQEQAVLSEILGKQEAANKIED